MSNLILRAERVYSAALRWIAAAWRFTKVAALPAMKKLESSAPVIEEVTGLVIPHAETAERVMFTVLALAIKAIEDADRAGSGSDGKVNLELGREVVLDVKAVMDAVRAKEKRS